MSAYHVGCESGVLCAPWALCVCAPTKSWAPCASTAVPECASTAPPACAECASTAAPEWTWAATPPVVGFAVEYPVAVGVFVLVSRAPHPARGPVVALFWFST